MTGCPAHQGRPNRTCRACQRTLTVESARHEYEPGDQQGPMSTGLLCGVCGEPDRGGNHHR